MSAHSFLSAWITGGGVWLLGLAALFAASQHTEDTARDVNESAASSYAAYRVHTQTSWLYQDPSGRYTAVLRATRPVESF